MKISKHTLISGLIVLLLIRHIYTDMPYQQAYNLFQEMCMSIQSSQFL